MAETQYAKRAEKQAKRLKGIVPRHVLEFSEVRKQLDPRLPDTVAKLVVGAGNERKIEELNRTARALSPHLSKWLVPFKAFENESLARLLVTYTAFFAEIGKPLGKGTKAAFDGLAMAMENERIARFFQSHPEAIVRIAFDAGPRAHDTFRAIATAVSNDRVSELFERHPSEFLELVACSGKSGGAVLIALGEEREPGKPYSYPKGVPFDRSPIGVLFDRHPAEFVEVIRRSGDLAERVLDHLRDVGAWNSFEDHPTEIAQVARHSGVMATALLGSLRYEKNTYPERRTIYGAKRLFDELPSLFVTLAKSSGGESKIGEISEHFPNTLYLLNGNMNDFAVRHTEDLAEMLGNAGQNAGRLLNALAYNTKGYFGYGSEGISVAELFEKNRELFLRASAATKSEFHAIVGLLPNPRIRELFLNHSKALIEMSKYVGNGLINALLVLDNDVGFRLFKDHPAEMIELARCAGPKVNEVFRVIGAPDVSVLFERYPKEFLRIARAARENTKDVFYDFTNPAFFQLYLQYPKEIIGFIRLARGDPMLFGAFGTLENPRLLAIFERNPQAYLDALTELVRFSKKAKAALDSERRPLPPWPPRKFASLLLPAGYESPTLQSLDRNFSHYKEAFELAMYVANTFGYAPAALAASIDVRRMGEEADSVEKLARLMKLLNGLHPDLARGIEPSPLVKTQISSFSPKALDESTLRSAADMAYLIRTFTDMKKGEWWSGMAKGVFDSRLSKLELRPGIIKPIRSIQDLESVRGLQAPFLDIAPSLHAKLSKLIADKTDFDAVIRSVTTSKGLNLAVLERIRQELNLVNRVLGDEFVLSIGVGISKREITRRNFSALLHDVELFFGSPSKNSDVNRLYELVGRFQASRLADYLAGHRSDFPASEVKAAIKTLGGMGVSVDIPESGISKAIRRISRGQLGYTVTKGVSRVVPGQAMREDIISITINKRPSGTRMAAGFELDHYFDQRGRRVATVVSGYRERGAMIAYEAQVGTGIRVDDLKSGSGRTIAALAVGAFTTGERKLADFAAIRGGVVNYLVSGRDGLAVFYPDGSFEIKNSRTLSRKDIRTPGYLMGGEPMRFRERIEDFNLFVNKVKRASASVMQGMLLLYDGELQLTEKSSGAPDKRRLLAVMADGSFALLDIDPRVTLLEAAVLARKMGARHAINLDTGMYDFSQVIDASGKTHALGTMDAERPSNLVIFYRETKQ